MTAKPSAGELADAMEAFERFIVRAGFTDWKRKRRGDGYLRPLVDRLWRAWPAPAQAGADLREALKPFVDHFEKEEARYIKIGGDPSFFGDDHPSFAISEDTFSMGVWRQARAALASQPSVTGVDAVREALEQIKAVCTDNDGDDCGHRLALRFVANVAARALASPPSVPGVDAVREALVLARRWIDPNDNGPPVAERNHEVLAVIDAALALIEQPLLENETCSR